MLQEGIDEYIASLSTKQQGRGEPEEPGEPRETNQNTIAAYRNDLNQACAYPAQKHIENWQQVTRAHIAACLLEMRDVQAYPPTPIARKLASLKPFFLYLHATGSIPVDPIE